MVHTPSISSTSGMLKQLRKQKELQFFAWLGMIYLLIFHFFPMFGLIMAFKNYSINSGIAGIFTSKWVGLKYFVQFVTDYRFEELVRNTVALSSLKLIFAFPVPILLAILIAECRSTVYRRIIQTVSYLPNFISWVLAYGIAVALLSESTGVINQILLSLGLVDKKIPFLSSPDMFWGVSVVLAVWKSAGWWAIIFLASISGIDPCLYEAAMCDGAGRLRRIWHVTLPGIKGSIVTVLILSIGSFLGGGMVGSNFEQAYLFGNNMNNSTSEIIQTYAFKMGLAEGRFAYATAVGLIESMIAITLILLSNFIVKRITEEGLF